MKFLWRIFDVSHASSLKLQNLIFNMENDKQIKLCRKLKFLFIKNCFFEIIIYLEVIFSLKILILSLENTRLLYQSKLPLSALEADKTTSSFRSTLTQQHMWKSFLYSVYVCGVFCYWFAWCVLVRAARIISSTFFTMRDYPLSFALCTI